MPWLMAFVIVTSYICSVVPHLYARKIAKEDGLPDKPTWFGGLRNLSVVPGILKKRSQQGDKWAARAHLLYWVGTAIVPIFVVGHMAGLWNVR